MSRAPDLHPGHEPLIPGELYPKLEAADYPDAPFEPALRPLGKAPFRMIFGLANDEIGYIIPRSEWDEVPPWLQNFPKRWYGEVNSVGPEATPRTLNVIADLMSGK